jgi:hypothetical protein
MRLQSEHNFHHFTSHRWRPCRGDWRIDKWEQLLNILTNRIMPQHQIQKVPLRHLQERPLSSEGALTFESHITTATEGQWYRNRLILERMHFPHPPNASITPHIFLLWAMSWILYFYQNCQQKFPCSLTLNMGSLKKRHQFSGTS